MSDLQNNQKNEVTVVDIKMSFISMVVFLVKLAIAAIPACIILGLIMAILSGIFGGVFMGMNSFSALISQY